DAVAAGHRRRRHSRSRHRKRGQPRGVTDRRLDPGRPMRGRDAIRPRREERRRQHGVPGRVRGRGSRRHTGRGGAAAPARRGGRRSQARGGGAPRPALETAARRRRNHGDRALPCLQPGTARGSTRRAAARRLAACHGHAARVAPKRSSDAVSMSAVLPDPSLTRVYRLEATVGEPLELGEIARGRRRIVPLTGGTFAGPELNGKLLPGVSADWQSVLPDGTALGDIRYTLQTNDGDLLYVQARGVRHGSADVLARLARGENVDASQYTFRTSTKIETAAPALDWLNKGVFISVGGRQAGAVIYETYLVG